MIKRPAFYGHAFCFILNLVLSVAEVSDFRILTSSYSFTNLLTTLTSPVLSLIKYIPGERL